jgi:hypothetical protein
MAGRTGSGGAGHGILGGRCGATDCRPGARASAVPPVSNCGNAGSMARCARGDGETLRCSPLAARTPAGTPPALFTLSFVFSSSDCSSSCAPLAGEIDVDPLALEAGGPTRGPDLAARRLNSAHNRVCTSFPTTPRAPLALLWNSPQVVLGTKERRKTSSFSLSVFVSGPWEPLGFPEQPP